MRLSGKHILLGVTGGIAAYKSAMVLRLLQKEGAIVRVAMTQAATRFIGVDTMAALSREQVAIEWFPEGDAISHTWSRHIHWAEWADAMVIAPCTANTMADIAHGKADNPLGALVLAAKCPLFIAPTMDGGMYRNPAVIRNRDLILSFGYHILEPQTGYLASGLIDIGRMMEPSDIVEAVANQLNSNQPKPLSGKHVLVAAGPTREYIDAVRFISNPSSGKMGFAMAVAARDAGADVTLIHGPVSIPIPEGVSAQSITSAADLFDAVKKSSDADIIIMAAAVSDFRSRSTVDHKIAKDKASLQIDLEQTTDILSWLGQNKRNGQLLVGFAMETDDMIERSKAKRVKKNADIILGNSIGDEGSGFGVDTNAIYYIGPDGEMEFSGEKTTIAREIIQHISSQLTARQTSHGE